MIPLRRWLLAPAMAASLAAPCAHAQDRAAAEAAFEEGRRLAQAGEFTAACAKFEESERAEPAIGTLLNLAECYGKTGRTASEWAALREASARAELAGQHQRADAARARTTAVERTLSRLQIVVPKDDTAPDLEVRRDGVVVGPGLWATPVPVDPGTHVVALILRGSVVWSQSIDVPQGPTLVVVVCPSARASEAGAAEVPAPSSTPDSARGTPGAAGEVRAAGSTNGAQNARPSPDKGRAGPQAGASRHVSLGREIGLMLLGVGVGGLASAAIDGGGALIAMHSQETERARGWAQAFDWTIVPAALASAAGLILVITQPSAPTSRSGASARPSLVARFGVSGISGTFP